MSVTIKDIAQRANVSHTTVSRALRDHPAIADATKKRIKQLAQDMNYVPNTSARELKTKRSKILGVMVTRIDDPFFGEVIQGIENAISTEGYSLFLAVSNQKVDREKQIIQLMSERRVEGLIICSTQVNDAHQAVLNRFDVTSVQINNQASERIGYEIAHDDVAGAANLVQYLVDLGHSRIAFLGNAKSGKTSRDRHIGYQQTLKKNKVPIQSDYFVEAVDGQIESGRQAVQTLLALPVRPTAIVCFNDLIGIGVMKALAEAGVSVPADCSVTGFDDVLSAAYVSPSLTTFAQPKFQLGHEAATMMLSLLKNKWDKRENVSQLIMLKGKLIKRDSTAKPP